MDDHLELSFVIPCFNEAETIRACVMKAVRFISDHNLAAEIIVADNGSHDDSKKLALACGATVVDVETRGYGAALQGGIKEAKGTYVIMGDADDSYDFLAVMPILEKLRQGNDLVLGNRFQGGIDKNAMPFLHRCLGNPGLTLLARIFFRSPVGDIYCGMRGFRREAIEELSLRSTGMEFAIEMVVKSTLFKKRICEVPFQLNVDGRSRPPHLRTWRDGWRTLRFMLLYSPNWLFLIPSSILFAFGSLLGGRLLLGPLTVFGIGLDASSLTVSAMALVLSVQLLCFFIFARTFAVQAGFLPSKSVASCTPCWLRLEAGVIAGVVLVILGFSLLANEFLEWKGLGFGALPYSDTLRKVVPAVTCVTIGAQIIFSSFLLSILGLAKRDD